MRVWGQWTGEMTHLAKPGDLNLISGIYMVRKRELISTGCLGNFYHVVYLLPGIAFGKADSAWLELNGRVLEYGPYCSWWVLTISLKKKKELFIIWLHHIHCHDLAMKSTGLLVKKLCPHLLVLLRIRWISRDRVWAAGHWGHALGKYTFISTPLLPPPFPGFHEVSSHALLFHEILPHIWTDTLLPSRHC